MKPVLALIAALADNGVIGAAGKLPWKLSSDLRRFKTLTLGKPVIMGRKTFQSIGRPLPGRVNIVITRQADFSPEGVLLVHDLDAALELAAQEAAKAGAGEIMVIGGGEIYRQAIGRAQRLYLTHVHAAPPGDSFFPPLDPVHWRKISAEHVSEGEADSAASDFIVYQALAVDSAGPADQG